MIKVYVCHYCRDFVETSHIYGSCKQCDKAVTTDFLLPEEIAAGYKSYCLAKADFWQSMAAEVE
ncbi:hypothetical protein [Streptococcus suis]|uniref:hypothetical protein n=1 Tax=Streptococcus suis TaxID=1307 RepID=UPI000415D087|nr:hypothetical protein [Streptococcus suis]MBM7319786.1 hypothetical protein [Streptococcus suis]HEM3198173.1 hypothetical protein [Streptococcus suis 14A]